MPKLRILRRILQTLHVAEELLVGEPFAVYDLQVLFQVVGGFHPDQSGFQGLARNGGYEIKMSRAVVVALEDFSAQRVRQNYPAHERLGRYYVQTQDLRSLQ